MTERLLRSLVRLYDNVYCSYARLKVVSFLVYKGKVIGFGVNSEKTSPMQYYYRIKTPLQEIENFLDKEHAEINSLRRTYLGDFNPKYIEAVIISKRKNGNYRLARPCCVCMRALQDMGIKTIYYTTNENTIKKERIL